MRIAVVIPTLDEAETLPETLRRLLAQEPDEVIVVDGGSRDGTPELVTPPARLMTTPPGRARQLNAGIAATRAGILVLLHADTWLPPGALDAVRRAIAEGAVGGAFHKSFRSEHPLLRLGVRARTAAWWRAGLCFGDQAQFARREALDALGGLREDVAAEDLDLAVRLRGRGRVVLLPAAVQTSARRLERDGVLRTWLRWWRVGLPAWRRARAEAQFGR